MKRQGNKACGKFDNWLMFCYFTEFQFPSKLSHSQKTSQGDNPISKKSSAAIVILGIANYYFQCNDRVIIQ